LKEDEIQSGTNAQRITENTEESTSLKDVLLDSSLSVTPLSSKVPNPLFDLSLEVLFFLKAGASAHTETSNNHKRFSKILNFQ
jgi:hypothetical protein